MQEKSATDLVHEHTAEALAQEGRRAQQAQSKEQQVVKVQQVACAQASIVTLVRERHHKSLRQGGKEADEAPALC